MDKLQLQLIKRLIMDDSWDALMKAKEGGSTKDIKAKKSNGLMDLALKKMEPENV